MIRLTTEEKRELARLIAELPAFKDTTFDKEDDDENYLTYNAVRLFDTIIVQEEFSSHTDNSTEYFIFNGKTLREATPEEDNYMRNGDQADEPFRELDVDFIISNSVKGVNRFDEEEE
jgi:hypothetical protein